MSIGNSNNKDNDTKGQAPPPAGFAVFVGRLWLKAQQHCFSLGGLVINGLGKFSLLIKSLAVSFAKLFTKFSLLIKSFAVSLAGRFKRSPSPAYKKKDSAGEETRLRRVKPAGFAVFVGRLWLKAQQHCFSLGGLAISGSRKTSLLIKSFAVSLAGRFKRSPSPADKVNDSGEETRLRRVKPAGFAVFVGRLWLKAQQHCFRLGGLVISGLAKLPFLLKPFVSLQLKIRQGFKSFASLLASFKRSIVLAINKFNIKPVPLRQKGGRVTFDTFLFVTAISVSAVFLFLNMVREMPVLKPSELVISYRCNDLLGKGAAETLIREFTGQNPELQITFKASETKGQESPAILIFDENEYSDYMKDEALLPLDSFTWFEYNSEQFAVPMFSYMDLLFYNIEILRAAGFDRPPKTRSEFIACARAVSNSGLASGAAIGLNPLDRQAVSRDVLSWIWAAGGSVWSDDPQNPVPQIDNKIAADVLSFLAALEQEGVLAKGSLTATGADRLEDFAQGRTAMIIASTRDIPVLREKMGGGVFSVTSVPGTVQQGRIGVKLSLIYGGISADCEIPETAGDFLFYIAGQGPALAAGLKAVPGAFFGNAPHFGPEERYSLTDYISGDPDYSKVWDIYEASEIVQGFSGEARAQEYEAIFLEELAAFFDNSRNAADTLKAIQDRWNNLALPQD